MHGRKLDWGSQYLPILRRKYRELPYTEAVDRNPDPLEDFRNTLRYILRLLRVRGIDVVVLGQPVLWKAVLSPTERIACGLVLIPPTVCDVCQAAGFSTR